MKKMSLYKKTLLNCDLGLYRIYWNTGGSSQAAIGQDHEGNRWIAPTNWTCKLGDNPCDLLSNRLNDIEGMVKIND